MQCEHTDKPVIKRLRIEAFRGFERPVDLDLAASAIVIWGANGRGKTSFSDAIQWLLLGSIPRLEALRFRKNEEHIVNSYAAAEKRSALVEAVFVLEHGELLAKRTGNYRTSLLEVRCDGKDLVGDQAENFFRSAISGTHLDQPEFIRYVLSMAILQQDVVRAFLAEETPDRRYSLLSRLLGLGIIDEFVDKLNSSSVTLSDREIVVKKSAEESRSRVSQLHQQKDELLARVSVASTYPSVEDVLRSLSTPPGPLSFWAEAKLCSNPAPQRISSLLSDLRNLDADILLLSGWFDDHRENLAQRSNLLERERLQQILSEISSSEVSLSKDLARAESNLSEAEQEYATLKERAQSLARLAEAALPLLGHQCPVCAQEIDAEDVEARLRSLLINSTSFQQAATARDEALTGVKLLRVELTEVRKKRTISESELRNVLHSDELFQRDLAVANASVARMIGLGIIVPDHLGDVVQDRRVDDAFAIGKTWLKHAGDLTRTAITSLQQAAVAESLDSSRIELETKEQLLAAAEETRRGRESDLREVQLEMQKRKQLIEQSRLAASHVVEETFSELAPVVQDLFGRLSPHPTFRRLSLEHQVYNRKGTSVPTAHDDDLSLDINPSVVFSSGQTNVAALCYFLAFAFASGDIRFPFVVLDDPIQAMDDINVLGFADLCRFLRSEKQLIITTHDDRMASLLLRKLAPRAEHFRTLSIHFSSWDRSGPVIEFEDIEPENAGSVLLH